MRNRVKPSAVAVALSATTGAVLLAVNLAGLFFFDLRAPQVDGYQDFAGSLTTPYDQALLELDDLDGLAGWPLLEGATRIFHRGMAHIDRVDRLLIGRQELHMTVPVWENYVLALLARLKPDTYRDYEFCNYRRALRRGLGRCGQQSLALVDFLDRKGVETGFVNLGGHTLVTARSETGWVMLDPDYGGAIPFDLDAAENDPLSVVPFYWNAQVSQRRMFELFDESGNEVNFGGPQARWGRACRIESIAYLLKWLLPVLLLAPYFFFWKSDRRVLGRRA